MKKWQRVVLLAGVLLLGPGIAGHIAGAAETQPVHSSRSVASLITDTDQIASSQPFHAALHLVLAPGWHVYWQNPGDAGIPPDLTFKPVPGAQFGPLEWPTPSRVAEGTLTTYAYRGDVVLPLLITPPEGRLHLEAHASWLICKDLCVPEEADFTLDLPTGVPAPSAQAASIAAARALEPQPAPFTASSDLRSTLYLAGSAFKDAKSAEFFPAGDGIVNAAGPQPLVPQGDGFAVRIDLGKQLPAAALPGVVELTSADGKVTAFEVAVQPGYTPPSGKPLLPLLLLALAGGLLLNLMPCVFPILAMKAMALARLSGAERHTIRSEAASYVLGVIAAFTALGGGFIALRNAGLAVGWGFQFQSATFVTAVAWLLFATGLNMSGVFTLGERLAGAGQTYAARGGHLGSFFTGLLAVVVATPCTASFMTAAIAGAIAEPAPVALLIFATLGVGLALPYALVAALPQMTRVLPRPGRWMAILRQVLAFPMYGATAWLVWVASQEAGPQGVLAVGAGLVGVGFAAWALGVAQLSASRISRNAGYGAAAIAAALVAMLLLPMQMGADTEPSEPFSASRLAELRAQGRPVFVNMTAAWCLSCLVNERVALSPSAVREAFVRGHVAYLKGDWTREDPAISAFLEQQGHDGVPLYVLYSRDGQPTVLPQILSQQTVLNALENAGG